MQIRKFVAENIVYASVAVVFSVLYVAYFRGVPGGAGKSYFFAAAVVFAAIIIVRFLGKWLEGRGGGADLPIEPE